MTSLAENRVAGLRRGLAQRCEQVEAVTAPAVAGQLTRMVGLALEASGCVAAIGDRCDIATPAGHSIEAEVVGFADDKLLLMPAGEPAGLTPSSRVVPRARSSGPPVTRALLGRVIDSSGQPLDGLGPLPVWHSLNGAGPLLNPLERAPIVEPLDVGVRAINALTTVGRGQRIGLFAGSGVGKSVLLGMMARYTSADVIVVGLIGERGREVKDFVDNILGPEGLARSVVVAAPADRAPLPRLHGAWLATAIAERYRSQGLNVLLLMDSLTRFAQAQREIGLAIGEAPATKGYPPSVFARLPQLVERAGNGRPGEGSITAFYTVLVEGDDTNDPIADAARAVLDGHLVLSRRVAESGRYPAIDVEASVSRVMHDIVPASQLEAARALKRAYSVYEQHRDLIAIGAYQRGADPRVDAALLQWPSIQRFLAQDLNERVTHPASIAGLAALQLTAESAA
jgi:flagellum-specific ATP synthase